MSRLRIPGLIDLLRVDRSSAIEALSADDRMDRAYEARGPLVNRIVLGRLRRSLQVDGRMLPPVAPRGPTRPTPEQASLEHRLDGIADTDPALGAGTDTISKLAAWVRGDGGADAIGPLSQQAVGRLYDERYTGDKSSWAAARVMGSAPSNLNPFRLLLWGITRRVERSRELLAGKVGRDPSAVHGTGVAIHNIVSGFEAMRKIYADKGERERLSTAAVLAHCVIAPRQVVRQPTAAGSADAGSFTPDTLVLLQLKKANDSQPGYDTAFMDGMWSACPARRWVPSLFASVWKKAIEGEQKP
jgi:hypothetical protein